MGPTFVIVLLLILFSAVWIAFSALSARRSRLAAGLSACLMLLAAGGAWYAWIESQSLPWTIGYLAFGTSAVAATAVGWIRANKSAAMHQPRRGSSRVAASRGD